MNEEQAVIDHAAAALGATLSATPSRTATAAVTAAAHTRAAAVRRRRRVRTVLSFVTPLAACIAITVGITWQSANTAKEKTLAGIVEICGPGDWDSESYRFADSLVAMQDYYAMMTFDYDDDDA